MILDTSAIIAVLLSEHDAEIYVDAISRARHNRISAGNFIELSLVLQSQFAAEVLQQCDALIRNTSIIIEPVTVEHAYLARQAFHDFGKD